MTNSTPTAVATSALSDTAVLDALSIALEHTPSIGLEQVRAEQRRYTDMPQPTGEALRAAANAAKQRAVQLLREQNTGVTEDEAIAAVTRALLAPSFEELFEVLDPCKAGELRRPTFIVDGLFYDGKMHTLFGRDGTNKSMLIIWAFAQLAQAGTDVLLIEYEMDSDAIAVMLDEMGFDREALRPHFHSIHPRQPFCRELLDAAVTRFPECRAVGLDNAAEAIGSAGGGSNGDENSAKDALIVLAPLRDLAHSDNGPAVIVADHLPHARDDAQRGTTAKKALDDVSYQVQTPHPVTRTQAGDIKLTCRKDRPSLIGKGTEIWHTVGDGNGGLPIRRIETPGKLTDELSADGAQIIVGLERYATENPGNPWLSKEKVYDACGLKKSRKRDDELERLAQDIMQPVEQRVQSRGKAAATTLYSVRKAAEDAAGLDLE